MSLEGWPGLVSLQHRSCPCHWSPAGCRCTYIVINVIFLRKLQKKKITGKVLKFEVKQHIWIYQNPLQLKCKFDVPCSAVSPTICCQTPRPNWLPCLLTDWTSNWIGSNIKFRVRSPIHLHPAAHHNQSAVCQNRILVLRRGNLSQTRMGRWQGEWGDKVNAHLM